MLKMVNQIKKYGAVPVMTGLIAVGTYVPAFAAEVSGDFDVVATLSTSFQQMADTMLATITAVLPVVLSVFSAYICIQFGFKFFKRFIK